MTLRVKLKNYDKLWNLMQTKKQSFIEACMNILFGYAVALGSQLLIFPLFGILIPMRDHIWISIYFTIISLTRSYIIRRYYNHKHRGQYVR